MSYIEKRKIDRFNIQIPALLQFDTGQVVEHLTRDVSSAGAFFYAGLSMPVGAAVKVDLLLPNLVQIKVNGSIVRSIHNGIAVCFGNRYKIIRGST